MEDGLVNRIPNYIVKDRQRFINKEVEYERKIEKYLVCVCTRTCDCMSIQLLIRKRQLL